MPQELRRPAAQQQHRCIPVHVHVVKRDVCVEPVALPLDVGVPAGLEVVHDQMEPAGGGRGHDGFVARLLKAVQRKQRLVALAGVSGDEQDPLRHMPRF